MKSLPRTRTFEITISRGNIEDLIIPFLYACTIVNDDEEVLSVSFDTSVLKSASHTLIPLTIKTRRNLNLKVKRIIQDVA